VDFKWSRATDLDTRGGQYTWAIPSPNGKYLAIYGPATERNAWMIENFY